MQAKKRITAVSFVLIALVAVSVVISHLSPSEVFGAQESNEPSNEPSVVQTSIPLMSTDNPYIIADIAELASPATVFIYVEWPLPEQDTQQRTVPQDPFSFFFDYWFSDPFYTPQPRIQQTSAGSGFIIDESGIILTNQHVVGNLGEGQTIAVVLDAPGLEREYTAEIVGADSKLDLAVLRIVDAEGPFPTVQLGDSDATRPGEWTIAIGNPYGQAFEHTVTVGVLSAKGREISIYNRDTGTTQVYKNLMQTDAAINRGNSGGPLLNIEGEVIGINTAVHSQAQGIGFAIPINVAKDVLDELIETGGVKHELPPRPYLGIYYQALNETLAKQLKMPDEKGIIISDVAKGSPAEEAGVEPWDVIRRIGDRDIFEIDDVKDEISKYEPGDELLLTIFRDGQVQLLTITVGNMPEELR